MKETRFFYHPEPLSGELPKDEAQHVVRVLRLGEGDEINLMDGRGTFYRAEITAATNHRCAYRIVSTEPQQPAWTGHLHLAVAPTKLNDRMEWLAEKATEVGFDELSFLDCQFSERRVIKTERIDKILVSAMKQSHKAWKPVVNEMQDFERFVKAERAGQKFICHCYDTSPQPSPQSGEGASKSQSPLSSSNTDYKTPSPFRERAGVRMFLLDALQPGDATVLIGPEGDFSIDEVRLAIAHGYQPVSLGRSRLRTETAALVAVHLMQIRNQR